MMTAPRLTVTAGWKLRRAQIQAQLDGLMSIPVRARGPVSSTRHLFTAAG